MNDSHIKMMWGILAVAMIGMAFIVVPVMGADDADAAAGDSSSDPYIQKAIQGQTWTYSPEFPSTLTPTVEVEYQGYDSWTATNGTYATYADGTLTVAIPSDATAGTYNIVLKAETTNPTQVARQYIQFQIVERLTLSGAATVTSYVGGSVDWEPTTNAADVTGATFTSTTLPAGLTLNKSTGVISGTPTAAASGTRVVVTLSATEPTQSKTFTVTFNIEAKNTVSGTGTITQYVGDADETMELSSNLGDGVSWEITDYDALSSDVISIDSSGVITVSGATAENVGTYTVTVQATSTTNAGNTATGTVTVVIAEHLEFGIPNFTLSAEA